MILESTYEDILRAMQQFDQNERSRAEWLDWQNKQNHKYALSHSEKLYPVKHIISMATGTPVNSFSGGNEANNYLRAKGYQIVDLHQGELFDEQQITEEKSVRSWSKPNGITNLIGRKKVDLSIFKYGSHIPLQFIEDFDEANGGYHLSRGESRDLVLKVDGYTYNAKLVNVDRKGFNKDTLQIRWDGNIEIIEWLKGRFDETYQRLMSNTDDTGADSNNAQHDYIDFIKTDIPFEYEVELHVGGVNVGKEIDSKQIGNIFRVILDEYLPARYNEPFGGNNPIRQRFEQLKLLLSNHITLSDNIQIKWSVGQGNWANVPWIAFLDKRETSSTQKGIYVVYLFCEDMNGYYLTLNQGVTEVINQEGISRRNAREILRETARTVKEKYPELKSLNFNLDDEIDLHSNSNLAKNYEYGTIAQRYYPKGEIAADEVLIQDLRNLLDTYGNYIDAKTSGKPVKIPTKPFNLDERVSKLVQTILSQGYTFEPWQIATYVAALKTKPFVILAGVSGTGKSKLPSLIANATGAKRKLIPVRPDWTDSSDVLGYCDLQGSFRPGALLSFAREAEGIKEQHHVCIIDEMNLARVEHYFAEVLSQIEDRNFDGSGGYKSDPLISHKVNDEDIAWATQGLPPNMAIIGTVNMDESTNGFSRKVLDRAFTIEFSEIDLSSWENITSAEPAQTDKWPAQAWYPRAIRLGELTNVTDQDKQDIAQVIGVLTEINKILTKAQLQVGFRVRDEIALFVLNAREMLSSFVNSKGNMVDPLDMAIQMKILPRIIGGSSSIRQVLQDLLAWSTGQTFANDEDAQLQVDIWINAGRPSVIQDGKFPRTAARLCLMWDRLVNEGFTSFWM